MAALTTSALIDLILTHTEEVGATDNENATLRARILARAQEILDKVWENADWDFKLKQTTVSMTTAGVADLPSDWADFGENGGVYISGQKWKLVYLEPRELYRRKEVYGSTSTNPDFFTVNTFTSSTSARTITVYPTPTATLTLNVYYNSVAPTLVDETTGTNNLQGLPAQYHYSVMVAGLRLLTAIDKGDARDQQFAQWFDTEMKRMKSRHVFGREQGQQLGQYGGVPSYRSW